MPPFQSTSAFIFFMGIFSFFGCNDKEQKTTKKTSELDTITFAELSKKSYAYLYKQQDLCDSIYKIAKYEHWFYDQYTGELTFSDNGITKLIVDYEEVGSLSFKSNTWLWAWENPHVEQKVKSAIGIVRDYGLKRRFEKLISPKWTADQYDGWEMTAIAAYLMKAKGAYRVPSRDSLLYSFMIYKNIRWPDSTKYH